MTGLPDAVETLMPHVAADNTRALLAASNGNIYDVTSAGTLSAPIASGYLNSRFQTAQFKDRLFAVNGADAPAVYDGSTWSDAGFSGTGLDATTLASVTLHQARLYFIEDDSGRFWYAGPGSISGTLNSFDLSPLATSGGELMAMGSWSRDGGSGPDDLAVFVMSGGDVLVYSGSDPASASTWSLVGVYRIGRPLGRRCLVKTGPDLIVLTEDGYVSLSAALSEARSSGGSTSPSDIIRSAVMENARDNLYSFGWQAVLYPRDGLLIINAPSMRNQYEQHVLSLASGAWCRFVGMPALCWAVSDEGLYFGDGAGGIYQADEGYLDDDSNIEAECRTSFQPIGERGIKRFLMLRPILAAESPITYTLGFDTDFSNAEIGFEPNYGEVVGALWNLAIWDEEAWANAITAFTDWHVIQGLGETFSIRIKTSTRAQPVRIIGFDLMHQPGFGL
ncbi:hypothetical protein [Magnetofaba australis]|uniref:Uncharacterized protein n=1 Tax=Magnetofaba australis IT-1 TaxID=1434232 RepID=A0A1Y2K994_9PROT|nr:hypothetical protein [Magnetofaba australis]OSM07252.1 hypothetical protein MAIT1_03815 [Magnetofaba australis IT-1]